MSECTKDPCFCCQRGHYCEPDRSAQHVGDMWECPECGIEWFGYDVHDKAAEHAANGGRVYESILRTIPLGTLGWTTETRL